MKKSEKQANRTNKKPSLKINDRSVYTLKTVKAIKIALVLVSGLLTLSGCFIHPTYRSELTLDPQIHNPFLDQERRKDTETPFKEKLPDSYALSGNHQIHLWLDNGQRLALTVNEAYEYVIRKSITCNCEVHLQLHRSRCYLKAKPKEKKILSQRVRYVKITSNCFQNIRYIY